MEPGGELRLGIRVIVILGIKQNCTVTIKNNKSVQTNIDIFILKLCNGANVKEVK